jgi:outer membrane biogenesis lipoprotein LolB
MGWMGLRSAWLPRVAVLGMSVLLLACAHVAGPETASRAGSRTDTWQVAGRFAAGQLPVNGGVENEPVAGRFAWQHAPSEDVLWLIGPLGNTLARVDMTAGSVRWQDATGKRGEATNLGALGQSLAGIALPDLPAARWLRAQWPADAVQQRDAEARVLAAAGRSWQFAYRYGSPAPGDWPLAIDAAGPDGLWLRLALTEWNGVSDPSEQPAP